jgi:hypothetical protein
MSDDIGIPAYAHLSWMCLFFLFSLGDVLLHGRYSHLILIAEDAFIFFFFFFEK